MKSTIGVLSAWLTAAVCTVAAPAPANLNGAVLVLDYSRAEFSVETATAGNSGWVSLNEVTVSRKDVADAFRAAGVQPKKTRRLLPITAPGQGGIYTYRCMGNDRGVIDIDMWRSQLVGAMRIITLRFTSPTSAVADEGIYHGCHIAMVRNINVSIQNVSAGKSDSSADGLSALRRELEKKRFITPVQRLYRSRLLQLLQRIEAGEGVNITTPEGKGSTALHLACELSYTELVSWLLNHGADVHARTHSGATPADCVTGPNAAPIRRLLNVAASGK